MKIALAHDHLISDGGAERVLKAFAEIWPESPIFTLIYDPKKSPVFFDRKKIITSSLQKLPLATKKYQWYLPLRAKAVEGFDFSGFDLVLSNSSAHMKGIVKSEKTLHINYCHTPTRYLWIDMERLDPLERIWPVSWASDQYKKYLRKWDQRAVARVDNFIANSENVRRRIRRIYLKDSTVIYPPIDTNKFQVSEKKKKYFLTGGRVVPYKKFDVVIQAFNKLGLPLKIFGTGIDLPRLRNLATSNIEFLGRVSDERLAALYSQAKAFIFPQQEDFGMTIIEAMASGTPVVAYGAGGALETVLPGKTGVFMKEQIWEELADIIIRQDFTKFDTEFIKRFADKFSVDNFKQQITNFVNAKWQQFNQQL